MSRRTYYYILAVVLCSFSFLSMANDVLFRFGIFNQTLIFRIRDLLVIFIVIYETATAANPFRLINIVALLIMFLGLMFKIMHWPFGSILFLASALTILIVLLINHKWNTVQKWPASIVLAIAVVHFIGICWAAFHYPAAGLIWFLELFFMFCVGTILFTYLYRTR